MRFGVTGAGGFLGRYLLEALSRAFPAEEIVAFARRIPTNRIGGVTYQTEFEPVGVLFHLAGSKGIASSIRDPELDLSSNVLTTLRVLEAMKAEDLSTLVLASSCAVYGAVEGAAFETQQLRPISPYGLSKLTAEQYALLYHRRDGLDIRIARIGNLYGPGQDKLVVYDLAKRILDEGPPLRLRGDGAEIRDFVHAFDVAQALILLSERGRSGEIYNIGSGQPCSILKVGTLIARAAGLPADVVLPDGKSEPGKVQVFYPDIGRLCALGFRVSVSIDRGIEETVEWVREHN